ncbi:DEAD/DEAH box helicase [[Clostridium] sordellii]|uniref:DEAD/DEAH box helicase n=1 Tax=Paraclostridium sordellii TaxID=1505 RepID=UPI0005E238F0|nr:SNF2-related protein [Paeniclostridium sordellii]CEP95796.1 DEAD/DEAH box helicase [[Clostridium] sordellii] [Paeniclostridium sordellii]
MQLKELIDVVMESTTKSMWARGYTYYKKGIVDQVTPQIQNGILTIDGIIGADFSNEIYYTSLEIDLKRKKIIKARCNCIDFINNEGENSNFICKHNVATFLLYIDMLQKQIKKQKQDKKKKEKELDPSKQIIRLAKERLTKSRKINIDVYLSQKKGNIGTYYQVSFKIGNERMYVLKSIPEFIYSRKEKNNMKYGKDFEYNPINDYFSKEDEAIVSLMEEYINIDQKIYKESKNDIKLIEGKYLNIHESGLKKLLSTLVNKEILFTYDNTDISSIVKHDDIDLDFFISESENKLMLQSNSNKIIKLNDKGDILFFNNIIYLISDKQCYNYIPFYDVLCENEKIEFKNEDADGLLNGLLPVLKRASNNIRFDETLENQIRNNLDINFYFDKSNHGITCFIDYIYKDDNENNNKGYIIRNFKKENEIEYIVCSYGFERSGEKLICKLSPDELYEFFKEKIYELKKFGEIYYSDKLKKVKVYKSSDIKASFNLNKQNYLEFNFNIDDVEKSEIENILSALRNKRKYYKLNSGSYIDLEEEKMVKFLELVEDVKDRKVENDININKDNNINEVSYNLGNENSLYLKNFIEENDFNFIEGLEKINEISKKFETISKVNIDAPKELNANLREYQLQGLKWLKTLSYMEFGGILADEMGLGKTIQTISFLLSEKGKKSLVVAPTSLIYNWKNEFETFAPDLDVLVLHGNKNERKELLKQIESKDVILTTYTILKNDFNQLQNFIFDYCIIDEAQNIKNPYSQNSEAVKQVNAKVKFALTGTPIENNLLELWSIFDFIMPGYLYSKNKFQEKFIKNQESLCNLKKQIQPFMLRRLKKEVLSQLPDKIETKFFIEMSEEQKKVYKTFVEDIKEKMKSTDFDKDKITILSYLTTLRQLCLDPAIKVDNYKGDSGKINVLNEIVKDNIENNHKILIFSQFTSVLQNIGNELKKENIQYFYLDGKTNPKERVDLVDKFNKNENIRVFLISLKAGGTGLNLTSADVVIHFDPWWNPAIENQATDRAHRYGQKNVVEVIKLIAKGSIEENILKLQEDKKELIQSIISEDFKNESLIKMLSKEELINLISN